MLFYAIRFVLEKIKNIFSTLNKIRRNIMNSLMIKPSYMLDNFFRNIEPEVYSGYRSEFGPKTKIIEKDNEFQILLSMPGVKKENISIDIEDEKITVSSKQKTDFHQSDFVKSWTLPPNINIKNIKALYENGVLEINIPKNPIEKYSIKIE